MRRTNQTGSAMAESIVAMLAILPAFWAASYLGRTQDIQSAAVAGSRYMTWERLVWSKNSGAGASKGDAALTSEMQDRIYGNDRAGLLTSEGRDERRPSSDPLRQGLDGESLIATGNGGGVSATSGQQDPGVTGPVMRRAAFGDDVPEAAGVLGLDGDMLGVERDVIHTVTAEVPVRARMEERGHLTLGGRLDQHTAAPVTFKYSSGMLGTPWNAPNEQVYRDTTLRIVGDGVVTDVSKAVLNVAGAFGNSEITPFKEANSGASPEFVPESNIILDEYVE